MSVIYGNWVEAYMLFRGMQQAPLSPFQDKIETLGKAIKKKVQDHITKQDLDWTPLAHSTIRQKGFDKIYVETKEYFNSIDIEVLKDKKDVWELIVYPSGDHKESGLPMQLLGIYLEYGTNRIPERPLWRVVFSELENMPELKKLKE